MRTNRLIKSLSALSVVAMLALPGAAFAMPSADRSESAVAAPARNHVASPSRAIYFEAKQRQMEKMENQSARRSLLVAPEPGARFISYSAFKELQMERTLNGE